MFAIEAHDVSRAYRDPGGGERWALRGVSLGVEQGRIAVLVGPSGAGKSTLLALLGALEPPTGGRVRCLGRDLGSCSGAELTRVRRRIGHVFQSFALIPRLTAAENVTYPLIPRGLRRVERNRRAANWLDRLGLAAVLCRQASTLSGGEQQRVAVARAMAGDPELILADEPTSNLDPESARVVRDVFREAREIGSTLIISSHDPALTGMADAVYVLEQGRVVSSTGVEVPLPAGRGRAK